MSEHLFLTILSTLAQEIDMLRYQNEQLEQENKRLTEQNDYFISISIGKEKNK